jgi:large subunit GTPase 1
VTSQQITLTPFERNIEVWRQLWRVVERCDVVVQIVDARDPLLYRCEDLEKYVKETGAHKANVLVLNKADLLSPAFRYPVSHAYVCVWF